jgi:hypothetical protein
VIRTDMKFDVRTLKYRRRRNEVSEEELKKELDALPDEAEEAEPTATQFISTFEDRNYRH